MILGNIDNWFYKTRSWKRAMFWLAILMLAVWFLLCFGLDVWLGGFMNDLGLYIICSIFAGMILIVIYSIIYELTLKNEQKYIVVNPERTEEFICSDDSCDIIELMKQCDPKYYPIDIEYYKISSEKPEHINLMLVCHEVIDTRSHDTIATKDVHYMMEIFGHK